MATVAACVPTRNRSHYLAQSLQSILDQTRRPDRLVISDDASTDGTQQVIEEYRARLEAVSVEVAAFRHDPPLGQEANRRFAFQQGRCDYLAMLDDDDLWRPGFLGRLGGALNQAPTAAFAFSSLSIIDSLGNVAPRMSAYETQRSGRGALRPGLLDEVPYLALSGMPFMFGATLFRRAWLKQIDFIPEGTGVACDWATYCALGAAGGLALYLPEAMLLYRVHDGGRSSHGGADHVRSQLGAARKMEALMGLTSYHRRFERNAVQTHQSLIMKLAHEGRRREALVELRAFVHERGVRQMGNRLLIALPLVLLGADRLRRGRPLPKVS